MTCRPDVEPPSAGVCNAYLRHMSSAFDRLLWAINLLARNGFLVIPVSQLEQDPTLMEDRTQWAEVSCRILPAGACVACVGASSIEQVLANLADEEHGICNLRLDILECYPMSVWVWKASTCSNGNKYNAEHQ